MSMHRALQVILVIALAGIAFSGVLTYRELTGTIAPCPAASVVTGGSSTLLGLPVCVYGLVMYLAVAIVAALGLRGERGQHTTTAHRVPA